MEEERDKDPGKDGTGQVPSYWEKFNDEGDTAASQAAAVLEASVEVVHSGIPSNTRRQSAPSPNVTPVLTENLQNVELRHSPHRNNGGIVTLTQNGGNRRTNTGFSNEDH